jgi:hypothetical protein
LGSKRQSWKASALPLSYTRKALILLSCYLAAICFLVVVSSLLKLSLADQLQHAHRISTKSNSSERSSRNDSGPGALPNPPAIPQQTAVINATRAHQAEFGIAAPIACRCVQDLLNVVADPNDARVPEIARASLLEFGVNYGGSKSRFLNSTTFSRVSTLDFQEKVCSRGRCFYPLEAACRIGRSASAALESVCQTLSLRMIDDSATRLVAEKIIELAHRGVRDVETRSALALEHFADK